MLWLDLISRMWQLKIFQLLCYYYSWGLIASGPTSGNLWRAHWELLDIRLYRSDSEQWPWTINLCMYYVYSKIMLAQLHTKCTYLLTYPYQKNFPKMLLLKNLHFLINFSQQRPLIVLPQLLTKCTHHDFLCV